MSGLHECDHCHFRFETERAKNDHQEVCYGPKEGLTQKQYHEFLAAQEAELNMRLLCARCDGYGTVANPAFDGMSTQEMYDDIGYEETDEFLTEYTKRGGMYDVPCPCCKGEKVITRRRELEFQEELEYEAEVRAEQRMMGNY